MVDSMKNPQNVTIASDLKSLLSVLRTRRTKIFAYGFVFAFVACTAFLAFNPAGNGSPWVNNIFTSSSFSASIAPYRSQFSSFISHIFPNSSGGVGFLGSGVPVGDSAGGGVGSQKDGILGGKVDGSRENGVGSGGSRVPVGDRVEKGDGSRKDGILVGKNQTGAGIGSGGSGVTGKRVGSRENGTSGKNQTGIGVGVKKDGALTGKNQTGSGIGLQENKVPTKNQTGSGANSKESGVLAAKNQTAKGVPSNGSQKNGALAKNQTSTGVPAAASKKSSSPPAKAERKGDFTASHKRGNVSSTSPASNGGGRKGDGWIKALIGCDIFQGRWVKDDTYPLYPEGSCPHIDEPFDCYLNGRPDRAYQKLRWQPNGCSIPRLNATDMLERLRGKRLVFVGDSLNRNMWESLLCVLRNSVKDKTKVLEASGRHEFRTEGSYSFLFKDYNCTVEFFRSPFLVQEWEMPDGSGKKKETLRLDIIERSSSKYKNADVIVFNTGHWWTHEKTSKGKDYYQEGDRVYGELNVVEAFHKALNTWAKWVDANVNPKKTLVFFRGYSASHFSGGQWNSGGACDKETEPIKNEKYLSSYPPKMSVLESVIKGMKTRVSYLNITRLTDYRKDAHPSVYRKQNLTEEERKDPLRFQDCSHWCLPGVPDSWNELLYAQLLVKQYQMTH